MNLHLQQDCHENWDAMTATERGKFCASCQKEVLDFTTFSASAIKLYIEQNRGAFCGRFYADQFDSFNKNYQALPTPSRMKQWAAAAVLSAVVVLPSFGQETPPLSPDSPIETTINTSSSYQESVTLEGSVWDPVQKKAVIAAVIAVKGTNIGAITDNKGHFSIKVPRSEEKIELAINHAGYQLHSYQIVPNQSRAGLLVEIKSTTLPTTTTTELTKKKKRPKRRRSRRRMVYMGCPIF